jgi:hypothetical protein
VILAVTTIVILRRVRSQPYLAVGWFWFVGTLVPVIGLVQIGGAAHADRYYLLPDHRPVRGGGLGRPPNSHDDSRFPEAP